MPSSSPEGITFVVQGQDQCTGEGSRGAGATLQAVQAGSGTTIRHSVRIGAQRGGEEVRIVATPGQDVVLLEIAGGPTLTLHPEHARALIQAQGAPSAAGRGSANDVAGDATAVRVPVQLQWRGLESGEGLRDATRGFMGEVVLSAIHVVTGLGKNGAADLAAHAIGMHVDGQVEAGVYELDADSLTSLKGSGRIRAAVPPAAANAPLLVLLHGTFSDTAGTFGKLWTDHPDRVRALFARYGTVYALDHPTLGVSPIANARTLVDAMPKGARLHLVSHSRGGLVAEVLARVCSMPDDPFDAFSAPEYAAQRDELVALAARVKELGLTVERLVRVACPARGTLLASGRLDAFLSVFKWTLELAGIPVAPVLVDFINEVARRRADPAVLPGLASMVPDGPLVQWLHAAESPINGELRVVAGDMDGDSVTSWLKTLLSDAFYWTDNDLVVQTRSMYGGTPRAQGALFLLDQGARVSHFNYFSNDRTSEAIVNALLQDAPAGFGIIGPLSWAGESSTGARGAAVLVADGTSEPGKPALFVLPGILGSNLRVGDHRIWLGWRLMNGFGALAYAPNDQVEPDGPVELSYQRLSDFFAGTHEVVPFAFDWRKPMEEEAARLAAAVAAAIAARTTSGMPVRIVAHSMGGLLARVMQLEHGDVWSDMMRHADARVLMLGTPNDGSWAPMQVLSGDDTFGNVLAAVGAPFTSARARTFMAQFPGFMQLQAGLLDESRGLGREATWQALADFDSAYLERNSFWHCLPLQLHESRWGVPAQAVLDRAVALRRRLDAQAALADDGVAGKLVLVVGRAPYTPDGFEQNATQGFVYLDVPQDGDGRVTRTSAMLSGVRTWQADADHGSLPARQEAFVAYAELLETGNTSALPRVTAAARGTTELPAAHIRSRPARTKTGVTPPQHARDVFDPEPPRVGIRAPTGMPLCVTVVNGDLTFVRRPLFLGHYRSMRLTGTEKVINRLVGGAMETRLALGGYPENADAHLVFSNSSRDPNDPLKFPRPEAVIVVGLGEEGSLRPADLVKSVRQAVIGWSQRVSESLPLSDPLLDVAATLIGSGGVGVSAGQSAQLIAQGVREANQKLADDGVQWPRVGHLRLVELYLDRASDAWHALQVQSASAPGQFIVADTIQSAPGGLIRPADSGYRGANYDFITALTQVNARGDASICYTLDTKRARTEVRAQSMQMALVRGLVSTASNDVSGDTRIGRTLFNLLVPAEMEPFLGGTTEMLLELDSGTAGIPWELLDTDSGGGTGDPWAIRAKLLRKLRTENFREQPTDASPEANVLIIGEPKCPPGYPRLVGARNEASAVARKLAESGALSKHQITALVSPDDPNKSGADSLTVLNTLQQSPWRVVHIAGHGAPPESMGTEPLKPGDPPGASGNLRGVVLSDDTFLGPYEIKAMRAVPELVFVNCCHLAARSSDELLTPYDRSRFAANVAEALINIGVRCVIAAGWAVADEAASAFATTFYDALLRGHRFIDAVAEARIASRKLGGNTWAAYQCYGDPDWYLRAGAGDSQAPRTPLATEFSGIASALGLRIVLDAIAVQSQYQQDSQQSQRDRLRHLEARYAPVWGALGSVAEAFGRCWAELGDRELAVHWYERAIAAPDGSASLKASEHLANAMVRSAWDAVSALTGRHNAAAAGSDVALAEALSIARARIAQASALLDRPGTPTMERESLVGAMYKRLAMLEAAANRPAPESAAITRMRHHYQHAEVIARLSGHEEYFYPALNQMAADIALNAGRRGWKGLQPDYVHAVRQSLSRKAQSNPDFWSAIGVSELLVYEMIGTRTLASVCDVLVREYADLYNRISAARMWDSVHDTAQFVLTRYMRQTKSDTERAAAATLLEQLEKFSGVRTR